MSHSGAGALKRAVQRSDRRTPLAGEELPSVANFLAWTRCSSTFGHGSLPRECSAPTLSVLPRLCWLPRFASPWPLQTLVATLGSPSALRPPAEAAQTASQTASPQSLAIPLDPSRRRAKLHCHHSVVADPQGIGPSPYLLALRCSLAFPPAASHAASAARRPPGPFSFVPRHP
jgi:hypothetical protein